MKIAIYARVSDIKLKEDGQRRQDITRQLELLAPYAKAYPNAELTAPFLDDGVSAFKEDYNSRPAFLRLMNEIRAHRIQRVYVESLDRWSRRVIDGLLTLQEADACGCTIVSIGEGEIDFTTPQGWFKSLMALGFAEWASREQSWRVKQAVGRRKADKRYICNACGITHLGRHPLSCRCLKCTKKKGRAENRLAPPPQHNTLPKASLKRMPMLTAIIEKAPEGEGLL